MIDRADIRIYADVIQGSDEWLELRRGKITASQINRLLTPKLKIAENDKTRQHIYELAAQRISGYIEPQYISDAMLRGQEEEVDARELYHARVSPVETVGFVERSINGIVIGCSPDGLVGSDGIIEIKSRAQRFQVQTVAELRPATVPAEYFLQIQASLLVTGRSWCDFVSYSNGLPMIIVRTYPDAQAQDAILEAAQDAEARIAEILSAWEDRTSVEEPGVRVIPTVRKHREEIF